MKIDYFMGEAIKEAKKALKNNEVPIGGVLIDNYSHNIISRGHNRINSSSNAINHCEIFLKPYHQLNYGNYKLISFDLMSLLPEILYQKIGMSLLKTFLLYS